MIDPDSRTVISEEKEKLNNDELKEQFLSII